MELRSADLQGLQAARSADVAISQFRFLKKLLLVHGAWSYQRLSKLILCKFNVHALLSLIFKDSFYKNITFSLTLFWVRGSYRLL
jgi:phospholipid-transporting ATPase